MLRWLLLGLMLFGFATGLRDGWLVVKWSHLLNEVGFSEIDPDKPMNWNDFIFGWLDKDESQSSSN